MCQFAWLGVARHALVELLLLLLLLAVADAWPDVADANMINTDRGGYGSLSLNVSDVLPCVIVSSPTPPGTPNATAHDNLDPVPCDTQVNLTNDYRPQ